MTQSPETAESSETAAPAEPAEIYARPSLYYRRTRYAIVLVMLVFAALFAKDGWWTWPSHNVEFKKAVDENRKPPYKLRTDTDILAQKVLAIVLPILALPLLWWTFHNSRGGYRLRGGTLDIPGHPPIALTEITGVDKTKWKRKGILFVDYQTAQGTSGRFKLDDFVYLQEPTDEIGRRILRAAGEEEEEIIAPEGEDAEGGEVREEVAEGGEQGERREG